MAAICSRHGRSERLIPCLEIPTALVSDAEASEYEHFLAEYNQYWRTYFDPIAIRLKMTEKFCRAETIILPLIDNSIYTQLSRFLGGSEDPLDSLPVPDKNIFSTVLGFNKNELAEADFNDQSIRYGSAIFFPGCAADMESLKLQDFLLNILGNQAGLHVYDSVPMLSIDLSALMGIAASLINRGPARAQSPLAAGSVWLWIAFAIASLNAPVYVSMPIQEKRENDADNFLKRLFSQLRSCQAFEKSRAGFVSEHYQHELEDNLIAYCSTFHLGPAKFRVNWARIGKGIYIPSKLFILDDVLQAFRGVRKDSIHYSDPAAAAHAMVRFRSANWREVTADMAVNQAEINRAACLKNLTELSGVFRAQLALDRNDLSGNFARRFGTRICPQGGEYVFEGSSLFCQRHGSPCEPKQPHCASQHSFMDDTCALTAQLNFLHDGLQAILTIDRRRDS